MNVQHLTNDYHDAHIDRIALGPQKDLTLFLHLDPAWNTSIARHAVVRFGAIGNYEEVEVFFSAIPPSGDAFLAEVSNLEHNPRGGWLIDVKGHGKLSIESSRCIEKRR